MPVVACFGEALVDFVPAAPAAGDAGAGARHWQQLLGGSPYNVARGVGRLDVPAAFVGSVSTDFFGDELVAGLVDCGVATDEVRRLDLPSTLSFVRLDGASPSYAFYSAESADRSFVAEDAEALVARFAVLHFGSNSLVLEPGASELVSVMRAASGHGLVSLDPNVRPRLITDRAAYLARLDALVPLADIVKLSEEDAAFLDPGSPPTEVASRLLARGPALVVLTRGGDGSLAWTPTARASARARPVEVVDTIGAGDGFMAGVLAFLVERALTERCALASMGAGELDDLLELAGAVAGAVCTRRGAVMPTRAELGLSPLRA